jgi:hypothetical protein
MFELISHLYYDNDDEINLLKRHSIILNFTSNILITISLICMHLITVPLSNTPVLNILAFLWSVLLFLNPHTAAFVKVKAVYMIFSKDFLK